MAKITVSSKTSNSVTLWVSSLDTSWTNGTRTVHWFIGVPNAGYYSQTKTASIEDGVSSGGSVTFTGLSANTEYSVYCEIYHGTTLLASLEGLVTTSSSSSGGGGTASLAEWSWTVSNGTATDEETQRAYGAAVQALYVNRFSYRVWNDMVYKTKAILDSIGASWDNYYDFFSDTLMTENDRTLTASRFNSLRYNIGSHFSTGIQEVKTGDEVDGDYFKTLGQRINAWINSL
jgi:hypothetical protein